MTRVVAPCPSGGAEVEFRWSSAVQTVCVYCRSILVRHDVDLERVGEVGDLPPDPSPIQTGTAGIYRGRAFTVVGRIIYEHERGTWNEWHLGMDDGSSAWLSDAQLEYAVTALAAPEGPLPAASDWKAGRELTLGRERYRFRSITRARYRGVQGDLPFAYFGKQVVPFVDLGTRDGGFATIDYSEAEPLLFVGEWVEFGQLALSNLRQFDGWEVP
jgi:hypothetical protein